MFLEGKEPNHMYGLLELFENRDDLKEVQNIIYQKYFQSKKQAIILLLKNKNYCLFIIYFLF